MVLLSFPGHYNLSEKLAHIHMRRMAALAPPLCAPAGSSIISSSSSSSSINSCNEYTKHSSSVYIRHTQWLSLAQVSVKQLTTYRILKHISVLFHHNQPAKLRFARPLSPALLQSIGQHGLQELRQATAAWVRPLHTVTRLCGDVMEKL